MEQYGLPAGSMHLKPFRPRVAGLVKLFRSPLQSKLAAIRRLMEVYPQRRFILVGDDTSKDAEAYGTVAREKPEQVAHILIRLAHPERRQEKIETALHGVPDGRWSIFSDPSSIAGATEFAAAAAPLATANAASVISR